MSIIEVSQSVAMGDHIALEHVTSPSACASSVTSALSKAPATCHMISGVESSRSDGYLLDGDNAG